MMKSTGIVRRTDELGRIVIPKELRDTMDINTKDSMEIYTNGDQIILKKYQPSCIFCGNAEGLTVHRGKNICPACLAELTRETVFYLPKVVSL